MTPPTCESGALADLAPSKVLIVDDVPQNLLAMRAVLARDGVEVLTAASGREALELLLQHTVAVALLDVNMPDMNGFDLAELMRGSPRTHDVPIIFLTASPHDPLRAFQGYETGAVDFLHKPIEPHVIAGKVRVFIELDRQRRLLRAHNERLQRALQLNETMIAVMTHDLRTPLSVISLCADTLNLLPPGADRRLVVQRIQNSAHRMGRMIEQLLDFSKIRSGILQLEPRDGDLEAVTAVVVSEYRQSHAQVPITVDARGDLHGCFDLDRIGQVVANLVGNAVQHAAGDPVRVELDGTSPHALTIRVINRGHIADDLRSRLFEPFKGAFNPSSGLGLGLYIVDQFVRAHGGTTTATNTRDHVVVTATIERHCPDRRPVHEPFGRAAWERAPLTEGAPT